MMGIFYRSSLHSWHERNMVILWTARTWDYMYSIWICIYIYMDSKQWNWDDLCLCSLFSVSGRSDILRISCVYTKFLRWNDEYFLHNIWNIYLVFFHFGNTILWKHFILTTSHSKLFVLSIKIWLVGMLFHCLNF